MIKLLYNIAHTYGDKLLVLVWVLCVLVPNNPLNLPYTHRDQGLFLYAGWRINHGELPYIAVWDHKPPVIFYIDALGLALGNHSPWGVWLLEFVSLSLAALTGCKVMRKAFGALPALLATLLWLLTLQFIIQGGNLTTEYTLPLQFAALWLAVTLFEKPALDRRGWFLLGVLGAAAFFTKQTAIGIWVAIGLVLIFQRVRARQVKQLFSEGLTFLGGFGAACLAWVIFFGLQGGLAQFWSAAFVYNVVYSTAGANYFERIQRVSQAADMLALVGLPQLAAVGALAGLLRAGFKKDAPRGWLPLFAIGLVDLPIEFLLLTVSDRAYGHYYMTVLPGLAVLTATALWVIFNIKFLRAIHPHGKIALTTVLVVLSLYIAGTMAFNKYRLEGAGFRRLYQPNLALVSAIQANTDPQDTILLWGAEASVNYFSRRASPTRFVYQYPLYRPGYANEQMIIEFLDDLLRARPRLLIDTHNNLTPLYDFPIQTAAIQQRVAALRCRYRVTEDFTRAGWTFYEYAPAGCAP